MGGQQRTPWSPRARGAAAFRDGAVVEFRLNGRHRGLLLGVICRMMPSTLRLAVRVFKTKSQHRRHSNRLAYVSAANIIRVLPPEEWHVTQTLPDNPVFRVYALGANALAKRTDARRLADVAGRHRRRALRDAICASHETALMMHGRDCTRCGDAARDILLLPCCHAACGQCGAPGDVCVACGALVAMKIDASSWYGA
jgi:hypothetical protein